jgi:hypothetical protein
VFVWPDFLPVAAYEADLERAADPGESDERELIDKIVETKGRGAIDYLSEEVCQMLGAALLGAETRVYMDEG